MSAFGIHQSLRGRAMATCNIRNWQILLQKSVAAILEA
jgi:hypothetical protein